MFDRKDELKSIALAFIEITKLRTVCLLAEFHTILSNYFRKFWKFSINVIGSYVFRGKQYKFLSTLLFSLARSRSTRIQYKFGIVFYSFHFAERAEFMFIFAYRSLCRKKS